MDTVAKHADFTDDPTDEKAAAGEAAELRNIPARREWRFALTLAVGLWIVGGAVDRRLGRTR